MADQQQLFNGDDENDGRFVIQDRADHYFFQTGNAMNKDMTERDIANGVASVHMGQSQVVSAFRFSKEMWTFDGVKKWLEDRDFQPSNIQPAQFERESNLEIVMLEVQHASQITPVKLETNDTEDEEVLIDTVAVTPGVHQGFEISRAALERAYTRGKWRNVRFVMNHKYDKPTSVVGFGRQLRFEKDDPGPIIRGRIFDDRAKAGIKSGFFHSVSTHFLLMTRPYTKIVTDVATIVELTLTQKPEDGNAVIQKVATQRVKLSEDSSPPPTVEALNGGLIMSEKNENKGTDAPSTEAAPTQLTLEEKNSPPPTEPTATVATTELSLEQRSLQLEKQVMDLQKSNDQQLRLLQKHMEKNVQLEKEIDTISKTHQQDAAGAKAALLTQQGRFPDHGEPILSAFYATLSADQETLFHQIVQMMPVQLQFESRGQPLQQKPNLTDDQLEAVLLEQINNSWEATGGDGAAAQDKWLRPGGPNIWPASFSAAQQSHFGPNMQPQQSRPFAVPAAPQPQQYQQPPAPQYQPGPQPASLSRPDVNQLPPSFQSQGPIPAPVGAPSPLSGMGAQPLTHAPQKPPGVRDLYGGE